MSGKLITFEGIEGAGKSTLIEYLKNYWHFLGDKLLFTREPGGTKIAESVRQILLVPVAEESLCERAELLLIFASRAQHLAQVIRPALAQGKWVICDRFVDASYAYQHFGRGICADVLVWLEQFVVHDLQPDYTFLLDLDPALGLERSKKRSGGHDRFEQENLEFFARVRAGYLTRVQQFPDRFKIIDATQPLELVQQQLSALLAQITYA